MYFMQLVLLRNKHIEVPEMVCTDSTRNISKIKVCSHDAFDYVRVWGRQRVEDATANLNAGDAGSFGTRIDWEGERSSILQIAERRPDVTWKSSAPVHRWSSEGSTGWHVGGLLGSRSGWIVNGRARVEAFTWILAGKASLESVRSKVDDACGDRRDFLEMLAWQRELSVERVEDWHRSREKVIYIEHLWNFFRCLQSGGWIARGIWEGRFAGKNSD